MNPKSKGLGRGLGAIFEIEGKELPNKKKDVYKRQMLYCALFYRHIVQVLSPYCPAHSATLHKSQIRLLALDKIVVPGVLTSRSSTENSPSQEQLIHLCSLAFSLGLGYLT